MGHGSQVKMHIRIKSRIILRKNANEFMLRETIS